MDKNNSLANAIDVTSLKAQYDACCKHLLSHKQFLAFIMSRVVDEFAGMKWQEIVPYIEGEPEIGDGYVDANMPDRIHGEPTEDLTITDGERKFDILFKASLPNSDDKIELIINIEVQKDYNPGYSLLKRGIYYCSRLISRQLGTEFTKSDYDKIKKVYSIWICTNSNADYANTVTSYDFHRRVKHGKPAVDEEKDKKEYDLMSLNMICIGDSESEEYSDIIEFLGTLLSNTLSNKERKTTLNKKYEMPMTESVDEEVESMCNLSSAVFERGDKHGFERGTKNGILQTKREMILGLKEKLSVDEIAQLVKFPVDEVKRIIDEGQG